MMRKFSWHIKHYLPLIAILAVGVMGFALFGYDRGFQMVIILAMAASYVTWGIVHHHIHRDLHASVVLEYLAIAVLGLVLTYTLLFRA